MEARNQELQKQLVQLEERHRATAGKLESLEGALNLVADLLWVRLQDQVREVVDEAVEELEAKVIREIDNLEVTR